MEVKLVGELYNIRKSLEFINLIEGYGLIDLGFSGKKYTWCNNWGIHSMLWKILVMAMINDSLLENIP